MAKGEEGEFGFNMDFDIGICFCPMNLASYGYWPGSIVCAPSKLKFCTDSCSVSVKTTQICPGEFSVLLEILEIGLDLFSVFLETLKI